MAKCKECGAEIEFEKTESGKSRPINPDTKDVHFATCPARKRPHYPSNICVACGSVNIEELPGVGPHAGAIKCLDCGPRRWLPKESLA